MVGPSKILTVSYGTFSCTLEGFDEPFSTMKSIAEYFRDLAADDRYFGAEPPTPDAEMLHKIAEREVQRRVEARVQEDGIVLRQMESDAAEPAPAPVAAPAPVVEEPVEAEEAPVAAFAATDTEYEDEAEAEDLASAAPAPIEQDDDSVAAKLSRIRAVVGTAAAGAAAEDPFELPTAANDTFDSSIESAFADDYEEAPVEEDTAETDEADDAAPFLDAAEELTDDIPEDVVSEDETMADEAEALEAPVAEDVEDDLEAEGFEALAEAEAPAEFDAPEVEAEADAPLSAFEDDFDTVAEGETEAEPEAPAEELVAEEDDAADEAFDMAAFAAAHATPAPEDTDYEAEPVEAEFDASALHSILAETAQTETPQNEGDISGDDVVATEDDLADLEALDAAPEMDEESFEVDAPLLVASDADENFLSTLSEEDEAELLAELENVEADEAPELSDSAEEADTTAEAEAPEAEETLETEAPEADLVELQSADTGEDETAPAAASTGSDSAFERILEETNSKLDDSEGSRRRSAIAHLKAAVAATKADRMLSKLRKPSEIEAEEQSQYREDLAKVVRPRRTFEKGESASARPEPLADKPAPLVLVSELRVDEDAAKTETAMPASVLPRRVSMGNLALEEEQAADGETMVSTSFAEFAEQMGAKELPDLLEAAAAYSAFVEGNKHFSRPQIMRRVASFGDEIEYSREAGLRSFGQLLRQGKIQKLRRGQFTIREDTRFNPEARLAGE